MQGFRFRGSGAARARRSTREKAAGAAFSHEIAPGYGVRLATTWFAGSVASVRVNMVMNEPPAAVSPR